MIYAITFVEDDTFSSEIRLHSPSKILNDINKIAEIH